ncbi:hypothetical protein HBZS_104570 [Helicobacter bizzozeronii CCUG 35545]|nr:hypothetical protein HBZS_104570 [Helicobacter bizzozeronii CCUG 35545]
MSAASKKIKVAMEFKVVWDTLKKMRGMHNKKKQKDSQNNA